ncbi:hypothetical protein EZV62_008793 [Acer yangbiense]|uniref:C-JID domain-containing protein n=1 Tax=Acer yangbiense TaxID=1000413 RepID=A0A5C7IEQ9_9ROSI|nr:hypothetical protein EZV62_008793 [Acer yangbiense]
MASSSNVEFLFSFQQLNKLRYLDLSECINVTKFPLTSASIERLNLRNTAIEDVPSSIQSLTNLTELDLSGCTRLKHISASIFKLKSVRSLNLDYISELETFPEISETIEILNSLELSGTAITDLHSSIEHLNGLQRLTLHYCKNLEMLPSSICDLTSLKVLSLFNCTKLDKLPEKLGNLKSLRVLVVNGTAVGQLPSSITCLENLLTLNCSECRGLTILPPLSGLLSLSRLYLKKCNLIEIPEDIGCLSSLEFLDLRENMFESLPKSIKHLSKLKTLLLRDCNMLRSLTELPVALEELDAINCKQLCQALPDASEFKRCITSKYHNRCITRSSRQLCPLEYEYVNFSFTNCLNLDQKAVSNVFEESVKVISLLNLNTLFPLISLTLEITAIFLLQGSEEPPTDFSICLPGTEIPEWFTYQSSGSSINIPVLRQDLINRKLMGFALCVVLGIEEYHGYSEVDYLSVEIYCHSETWRDYIFFISSQNLIDEPVLIINSNHILLGYSLFSEFLFSSQNLEMLIANDSNYVNIPFEFKSEFKVKYCAVHPTYAEPIEIIGVTIEDIGVTSLKRSGRSNDNQEEVEPHPKRIFTQPN